MPPFRISFALFIIATLCFARVSTVAHADQGSGEPTALIPTEAKLNGKTYNRKQLIEHFRRVVFSSTIASTLLPPHENLQEVQAQIAAQQPTTYQLDGGRVTVEPPEPPWDILYDPTIFKRKYPWLYEYLYRDEGVPRYAAINKWTKPVRVSLGFPNDLKPLYIPETPKQDGAQDVARFRQQQAAYLQEWTVMAAAHNSRLSPSEKVIENIKDAEEAVVAEVKQHLPLLSELTGLPFSYLPHDKEALPTDVAELRLILVNKTDDACGPGWKTPFKRRVVPDPALRGKWWKCSSTSAMTVPGTPHVLNAYFREDFERYLTTAVLFTPEASQQVDGYLLPEADNSIGMSFCFITIDHAPETLKGLTRECLLRSLGLTGALWENATALLGHWNDPEQLLTLRERKRIPSVPPQVTEMDRFLVETLYRPEVVPGMTPQHLARQIAGTHK